MFVRLELSEKTLSLPKYEDIIQTPWPKQEKNGSPKFWVDLTFGWYVFTVILLFRTNSKKEHLDKNDFRRCYGNFFESAILKVTWSQLCLEFLLNNYEAHWQQHFQIHLTVKKFTDLLDHHMC